MIKSNRGQLSIFMGITLILIMGMLAFIINVGLFVKAKINLQNSVDAAAYAGASVQARQLTNIAYVNWEMRNTFKEWMFKYYVLGQLGLLNNPYSLGPTALSGANTRFYLTNPDATVGGASFATGYDKYNVPSICIHNNSGNNICPLYTLPGIPRFEAIGVAGISEIHEAFVNELVKEKSLNCIERSGLNFLTALAWAYSSGLKDIPGTPVVATNRPGAWPQALELAMRMRNLEMIVNRPPVPRPIDFNEAVQLSNQGVSFGLNERPVKAFMSAYRNLSGGKYKSESGNGQDEFSQSFKLTEIAPTPYQAQPNTVSSFLIPNTFKFPEAQPATTKHYLDLQAMPINYSTMFSTFAARSGTYEGSTTSEGACVISKTAMPIPGYILGFAKNPEVMTYYAVKGEAEFTGLFFPGSTGSVKLTAYAAAKPFGGRIGPKLFHFSDNGATLEPRNDLQKKSTAYVSGIKVVTASTVFDAGDPLPTTPAFWTTDTTKIGGVPEGTTSVTYGIPNMIYDFDSINDLNAQTGTTGRILVINKRTSAGLGSLIPETSGLYQTKQFKMLRSKLRDAGAGTKMTGDQVLESILLARGVTRYDALNYLIPDYRDIDGQEGNNATPMIKPLGGTLPGGAINYQLFAPLIGNELLYTNTAEVRNVVGSYMAANQEAIKSYLEALLKVSESILSQSSVGGTSVNMDAAKSLHINAGTANPFPPDMPAGDPTNAAAPGCNKDMASKFSHFFRKDYMACGIVPLEMLMNEYINKQLENSGDIYYRSTYYNPYPAGETMTAFLPGQRQNVHNAIAHNPLTDLPEHSALRNYYSTKFFNLALMMENTASGKNKIDYEMNPLLRESDTQSPSDLLDMRVQIRNTIKYDATSGLNKPFFLDF